MPVKAVTGGQGRVRGRRAGAQQGTGSTPSPPAPDPSFGTAFGSSTVSGVGNALTGSTLSAETIQFFDRLITIPSPTRQGLYIDLIDGLVVDGVWSNLDLLCIPAAGDLGTATTNLVSASYQALPQTGSESFTTDRGWVGTASSVSYINTNFNPSTATYYTRNSAFLAAWNVGAGTMIGRALITSNVDPNLKLFPHWDTTGKVYIGVNDDPFNVGPDNPGDATGWYVGDRPDASTKVTLRNNTQLVSFSSASSAPGNDIALVGNGDPSWITGVYAFGGHLTTTQHTALYNRLHTYLAAVGAV